jgi:hypothetical protein
VTAGNAAGSTQAISAATATAGGPPPGASATITPAPAVGPPAPPSTPGPATALRLTKVGLVGRRGVGAGQFLVFTVSARARVQITLARAGRARGKAADALRLGITARKGQNRYALRSLLGRRRPSRGTYALTLRAGNHAAKLRLTL